MCWRGVGGVGTAWVGVRFGFGFGWGMGMSWGDGKVAYGVFGRLRRFPGWCRRDCRVVRGVRNGKLWGELVGERKREGERVRSRCWLRGRVQARERER